MNTPIQPADAHIRQTVRLIRILTWIVCAALAAAVGLVSALPWILA